MSGAPHLGAEQRRTLLVNVCLVEVVEHPVEHRDLAALVPYDGKVEGGCRGGKGVDVLDPAGVRGDIVCGQSDELGGC